MFKKIKSKKDVAKFYRLLSPSSYDLTFPLKNVTGDYFAVRITEDPVYATPVFTTMGGQSQCPGETGTNKRQSEVTIREIVPRCGELKNSACTNLPHGEKASFGIIIINESPTGMYRK